MSQRLQERKPVTALQPGNALGERLVRAFWNQVIADALPETDSLRSEAVEGGGRGRQADVSREQSLPRDKEYREQLFEQVVHRAYHIAHDGVDLYPEPVRHVGLTEAELGIVRGLLEAGTLEVAGVPGDVRQAILEKLTVTKACGAGDASLSADRERADGPEAHVEARPSALPTASPHEQVARRVRSRRRRPTVLQTPLPAMEGAGL